MLCVSFGRRPGDFCRVVHQLHCRRCCRVAPAQDQLHETPAQDKPEVTGCWQVTVDRLLIEINQLLLTVTVTVTKNTCTCNGETTFNQSRPPNKECIQLYLYDLKSWPRPWYTNLTYIFWRCTSTPEMKFLGQGFQKSEHKQDRQTDATECTTMLHLWMATVTNLNQIETDAPSSTQRSDLFTCKPLAMCRWYRSKWKLIADRLYPPTAR